MTFRPQSWRIATGLATHTKDTGAIELYLQRHAIIWVIFLFYGIHGQMMQLLSARPR